MTYKSLITVVKAILVPVIFGRYATLPCLLVLCAGSEPMETGQVKKKKACHLLFLNIKIKKLYKSG